MAHRHKFYAAETGTAYQYFFVGSRPTNRPEGQGAGSDYLFVVTADQRPPFVLRVFVSSGALEVWQRHHGRELETNETYAAAKMRLYRAFDEIDRLRDEALNLVVNGDNILDLLEPLNL